MSVPAAIADVVRYCMAVSRGRALRAVARKTAFLAETDGRRADWSSAHIMEIAGTIYRCASARCL